MLKIPLLGARLFYVSTISYVNNGPDYFILHRETGQPLANATVQIWSRNMITKHQGTQRKK
jgi:hypothetical protein